MILASERVQSVPRRSAHRDPVGTVRRGITNWGFWHLIKLQSGWDSIDCYGSVVGLVEDDLLTDIQVDMRNNTEVVYTPIDDLLWASSHGLKPRPEIHEEDEIA